jgi:hypothetical protein
VSNPNALTITCSGVDTYYVQVRDHRTVVFRPVEREPWFPEYAARLELDIPSDPELRTAMRLLIASKALYDKACEAYAKLGTSLPLEALREVTQWIEHGGSEPDSIKETLRP